MAHCAFIRGLFDAAQFGIPGSKGKLSNFYYCVFLHSLSSNK